MRPQKKTRKSARTKTQRAGDARPETKFLIAAIGASAGGMEACNELLRHLPADTGMAYVLVQHLDPKHHSILTELLSKQTSMKVTEVSDGMKIEPNHVYVIPPNTTMSVSARTLELQPRDESSGAPMSIDRFMRSLAEEQGNRSIGVILSGSGTDGTLGMAEIQAQGGVTFAQDEASAKYDGMPRSAIAAGCVDYVLPPKGIARELARIARHPYVARDAEPEPEQEREQKDTGADTPGLHTIFQILRRATGVDFTHYRKTTILRRIQRRMVVHKIDRLGDYVKYVQTNTAEIKSLYQDMLINVTSFFRNPPVFEALKARVFPAILRNRPPGTAIRVWTPGCASGEETYSVAIALLEFLGGKASQFPIQMFGTDVSESSVGKARAGMYPENIQGDVSAERLRRFFNRSEAGYRISKNIRDICIFAQHNIVNDSPFSQMDLICCRNLLIYLEPMLQAKVISLFHYAIRGNGFLLLGTSEGVGSAGNLFSTEDRASKIFSKKTTPTRQVVTFSLARHPDRIDYGSSRPLARTPEFAANSVEAQREFDRRLLTHFAPAAVFVNEDLEIVHTRGAVNRYLKLAPGRASLNILKMAREGLHLELRNALNRAKKENVAVYKRNVLIKNGNGNGNGSAGGSDHKKESVRSVDFEVHPVRLTSLKELYLMIFFQDTPVEMPAPRRTGRGTDAAGTRNAVIEKLEQELSATKEYLQAVIETQEATNEELQSANEEILSSNEELQSTNEELETAKEELQSANEELTTVNDELRNRNQEVTHVNNDLSNLLSSIEIAVVMVGSDLVIRRFTPAAQRLLGLIPADVGRPFVNINPSVEIPDFPAVVLQVISSGRSTEKQVSDRKGKIYQLRVLPYRTPEDKTDGVVVTIMDSVERV